MRILGIADVGYVHTRKWASYLASRGHEVYLVTFRGRPSPEGHAAGVSVDSWCLPRFHVRRFWVTAAALVRLRRAAGRFRPDLVHAHFLGHGAWYAALAGLTPLVLSVMGGGDVTGTAWKPRTKPEKLLTPWALRRASLILCWSRNLQRIVEPFARPGVPVRVLVGGVDPDLFRRRPDGEVVRQRLGLAPGDPLLFCPRLLWPLQNIHVAVQAMPHVLASLPKARLIALRHEARAQPDYVRQVEALVDSLGLRPSVHILPALDQSEMPRYFSAADCAISIPDTDGTPMTVMESLACETPAIIHDLPDYDPELFAHQQTVLRVPLRDPRALAEAVVRVCRDPSLRDTLARNGRRIVEERANYWTEMERLEGLYRQVVGKRA